MGYPNSNEWLKPSPVTQVDALLHLLRVLNLPSEGSTTRAKVPPEASIDTFLIHASEASELLSSILGEDFTEE